MNLTMTPKQAFLSMVTFINVESKNSKMLEIMDVISALETGTWSDGKPNALNKWLFWKQVVEENFTLKQKEKNNEYLMTCEQAHLAMTFFLKGKYDDDPLGLFSKVTKEINDYIKNQNPDLTKKDNVWDYWLRCCEESLKYELNYD